MIRPSLGDSKGALGFLETHEASTVLDLEVHHVCRIYGNPGDGIDLL